ncbi:MAG: response regulator [Lachnospiraceae bacterium]|nr:response regulator [Lachnospiraceae bacterium]
MKKLKSLRALILTIAACMMLFLLIRTVSVRADDSDTPGDAKIGGGYAVTGQLEGVGYTAKLYNSDNGLLTSEMNFVLGMSDGFVLVGGYSGVFKYDGTKFEALDPLEGFTNGMSAFEDSRHRIWVGTNDNGLVVIDGSENKRLTKKDGLPASSVRAFAEDDKGNIIVGTTTGLSYVTTDDKGHLALNPIGDSRLDKRIIRLVTGADGTVYGNTQDGDVFSISNCAVSGFRANAELGIEKVSTVYADRTVPGKLYIGTESDILYYGSFEGTAGDLERISVAPLSNIYWITEVCGRLWITSGNGAGYLENNSFHALEGVPMHEAVEMLSTDYQENLWFASSKQGVMKVVANNFYNLSERSGMGEEVVNAVCLFNNRLYIGTNNGLVILDDKNNIIEDDVTGYFANTRIRCLTKDDKNNLWISTYANNLGLVCLSATGRMASFTTDNGMPNNKVRCTACTPDGDILAGTNGGLAVIRDGKVIKTAGKSDVVTNCDFLTVAPGEGGIIYAGSDGGGLYIFGPDGTEKELKDDDLTSGTILRIKWDQTRNIHWIITSNSIEYLKNGKVTPVNSFPYKNNFDIYFDDNDNAWVLSSRGIYCVSVNDMLNDSIIKDIGYKLYSHADGLPSVPNSNSYSELDSDRNLYIAGLAGVSVVNIDHYFEEGTKVKTGIKSITVNDEVIAPDADGKKYTIEAKKANGRIRITPSVMDYTMTNPLVSVYLEGTSDEGKTSLQSELETLEYTNLKYGTYVLHIKIMDGATRNVIQDDTFTIVREPKFFELTIVRIMLVMLLVIAAGIIVWRVMTGTVIRKQYEQIRIAKDEAERANGAKSRFLANMSHEIRTPINTIMGMDEMILREDAADVPKHYFMSVVNYALDIKSASESLLGLINNLLDMSRIESGKMNLIEREYDTQQLLRSVITMIRVRGNEKDLTFGINVDEKLPARLHGDADKIKQVMLNLLSNAVKYTEIGGFTLKVSVDGIKDNVCSLRFSVRDTGIGIKPEDMDKLFSAYERLDEQRNAGTVGTGLGLDISRQFVELMGGKLWCESVYGEGSEFIFTLEQKMVDNAVVGKFNEHDDSESRGPYVPQFIAPDAEVLVVDDNPMNLNVVKGLLKATKMFVTTATSGEECLEMLKYGKYNVVLLDHMMPGMDGIETIAKIRETDPDLPVYALTANATVGEDFYKSKGFNGYLSKPVDSAILESTIMRHIPVENMMKPGNNDPFKDLTALPEEYKWVESETDLNVPEGIKNSGGVSSFIFAMNLFYDTVDENSNVIEAAYTGGDFKTYAAKVHQLRNSAKIIGAKELTTLTEKIENAIADENMEFVRLNAVKLIEEYRSYKDKLAKLKSMRK